MDSEDFKPDKSNGYDGQADAFVRARNPEIGASVVREWSQSLPERASVLDLGCGNGIPISRALVDRGLSVHGIDASPRMLSAFRRNFPQCPAECAAVEESGFFGRSFDGIVAWGLMFLLPPAIQEQVIGKIAMAINLGGQFLFTAPEKACTWDDALTGRRSESLGVGRYREILRDQGLTLTGERNDDGGNHYYFAMRVR